MSNELTQALLMLEIAKNHFNNAVGKDVEVAVHELNWAEANLNRVIELAKEGELCQVNIIAKVK